MAGEAVRMQDGQERATRVLVVGGGAAGVVTAAALLRDTPVPLDVRIVERGDVVGPGLAYGTEDPLHLLNNYAGRMSALEDDPEDLLRWCAAEGVEATPDTFLPRRTYGRYLATLLDRVEVPAGSRLSRLRGEVVDLDDTGVGYQVTLASGATVRPTSWCWRWATRRRARSRPPVSTSPPWTPSWRTPGRPASPTGSPTTAGCCWSAPA